MQIQDCICTTCGTVLFTHVQLLLFGVAGGRVPSLADVQGVQTKPGEN